MDHLRALRLLGLPPGASPDEIRTAWRDLARVWHPDRFAGDERLRLKAGENLSRINQAHEALQDYDPSASHGVAVRVRESVAIMFGIGELGEPPASGAPGFEAEPARITPRGPIGLRTSLRVLGLGGRRLSQSMSRPGPLARFIPVGIILAVLLAALWLTT